MRELYFPPLQTKDGYERKFDEHIARIRDSDLTPTQKLSLYKHGIIVLRNLRNNNAAKDPVNKSAPALSDKADASRAPPLDVTNPTSPLVNTNATTAFNWNITKREADSPKKKSKTKPKKKKVIKPPFNWKNTPSKETPRRHKPNQRYFGKLWAK